MRYLAVAVVACGLVAGAIGCGGSDDSSTAAIDLPTVTAPTVPKAQSTTGDSAPAPRPSEAQSSPARGAAEEPSCQEVLSKTACRALSEAGDQGSSGSPVERCPALLDAETCRELEQKARSGAAGSNRIPGCNGVSSAECQARIDEFLGR